jgi:hypothetical protein
LVHFKKSFGKMISHLRIATVNPNYRSPGCFTGNTALKSGRADRTSSLQSSLQGLFYSKTNKPAERIVSHGDMPNHFGGRGHLEGSCMAKTEGLLENKGEKRKRKRKEKKRGKKGKNKNGDMSDDDDYYSEDSSSDEEEEERKVWKPTSLYLQTDPKNPFSSSKAQPPPLPQNQLTKPSGNKATAAATGAATTSGVEADIISLNKEGLDWSKTSKYGKKSNQNFQEWLDIMIKKMHEKQVESEDCLLGGGTTF